MQLICSGWQLRKRPWTSIFVCSNRFRTKRHWVCYGRSDGILRSHAMIACCSCSLHNKNCQEICLWCLGFDPRLRLLTYIICSVSLQRHFSPTLNPLDCMGARKAWVWSAARMDGQLYWQSHARTAGKFWSQSACHDLPRSCKKSGCHLTAHARPGKSFLGSQSLCAMQLIMN